MRPPPHPRPSCRLHRVLVAAVAVDVVDAIDDVVDAIDVDVAADSTVSASSPIAVAVAVDATVSAPSPIAVAPELPRRSPVVVGAGRSILVRSRHSYCNHITESGRSILVRSRH